MFDKSSGRSPGTLAGVREWGIGDLGALTEVVAAALPGERLTADELAACCFEDPGVVLASPDGDGVVAAVRRPLGATSLVFVKLVAVRPGAQRAGLGRRLLAAVEAWAFDGGAAGVHLAGSAPAYLWPGVDASWVGMLCLAEAAGYEPVGAELNMGLPTTYRSDLPAGVEVRRVLEDADVAAVVGLVAGEWPHWLPELDRAIEQGGCLAAWRGGEVVAFGCHSVNRAGWIGPMGTVPAAGRGGIGHALLGLLCRDLMIAGHERAEIAWVGPVRFYAKAGAEVSRVFRTYRKERTRAS